MVVERLASRLAEEDSCRPIEIDLIDAVEVGAGRIFRTDQPDWFLMNTMAGMVSAFSGGAGRGAGPARRRALAVRVVAGAGPGQRLPGRLRAAGRVRPLHPDAARRGRGQPARARADRAGARVRRGRRPRRPRVPAHAVRRERAARRRRWCSPPDTPQWTRWAGSSSWPSSPPAAPGCATSPATRLRTCRWTPSTRTPRSASSASGLSFYDVMVALTIGRGGAVRHRPRTGGCATSPAATSRSWWPARAAGCRCRRAGATRSRCATPSARGCSPRPTSAADVDRAAGLPRRRVPVAAERGEPRLLRHDAAPGRRRGHRAGVRRGGDACRARCRAAGRRGHRGEVRPRGGAAARPRRAGAPVRRPDVRRPGGVRRRGARGDRRGRGRGGRRATSPRRSRPGWTCSATAAGSSCSWPTSPGSTRSRTGGTSSAGTRRAASSSRAARRRCGCSRCWR